MALKEIAEETVAALTDTMTGSVSDKDKHEMSGIIGKALLQALEHAADSHRRATVSCCGPDADLAHKIADEVERAHIALKANLGAMR